MKISDTMVENIVGREDKTYFKIDQHLARHFEYYGECLSSPPPILCSQIITPFQLSSSIT